VGRQLALLADNKSAMLTGLLDGPQTAVVGCRSVRAGAQIRAHGFGAVVTVAVTAASLLLTGGAGAEPEGDRLRSANGNLASESHGVLLELYALESSLGRVERRLADLRAEVDSVARREAAARSHLALVRRTLAEAEFRLGARLRELYVQGEADPLAVLLGSSSLDEAISTIDNLGRFARQDRTIVAQVRDARRELQAALRDLAAEKAALRELEAEAEAARASLLRTQRERRAYLARLLRERRVNRAQLTRLSNRADEAEAKSVEVVETESAPPPASAPPTLVTAGPGTTMTVVSTGYALKGTTATGVPVGWGIVAVDPAVIPLGTRMTIPGYGAGVAADTGGAIKGRIIDLWFPTVGQALAWGRRTVTITLH
jgi:3D (Asp-Asp-Asp) domain-containing protein/peptidoglycan hydrolase CwlO-like protein